uniref:Uncharacterized protein n=1 Tax=Oryza barthii TaxID=65489 RepID=A0A0D3G526_9ORYZ
MAMVTRCWSTASWRPHAVVEFAKSHGSVICGTGRQAAVFHAVMTGRMTSSCYLAGACCHGIVNVVESCSTEEVSSESLETSPSLPRLHQPNTSSGDGNCRTALRAMVLPSSESPCQSSDRHHPVESLVMTLLVAVISPPTSADHLRWCYHLPHTRR